MAPTTVLLLCHKLPNLSAAEFRNYIEEVHSPFVKSLLGSEFPLTHTRYYTNKESGFAIGSPSPTDPDLFAVITYESEDAMRRSMSKRASDGIREQIQADEDKFMDRSKVQVVVLGPADVGRGTRDE